jgi:hypothetical protein
MSDKASQPDLCDHRQDATDVFDVRKFTAIFDVDEDRLRLNTVDYHSRAEVIYFTKRLLDRLIPVLAENLEKTDTSSTMVQQFEQDRVRINREQMPPDTPDASFRDAPTWLCKAVRVSPCENGLVLSFLENNEPVTQMRLSWTDIRSFMDILLLTYRRGHWVTSVFPDWIRPKPQTRRHLQTHRLQ